MTTESLMGATTTDSAPATPEAAAAPAPTAVPDTAVTDAPAAQAAAAEAPAAPADAKPSDADATAKAAKAAEEKAAEKPAGAPEKYELKAPEGMALNADVQTKFEGVARELGLTQDQAQKLVETMQPQMAAAQAQQVEAVKAQWAEEAKADKEFGGEKFSENLAIAKKGLDAVSSAALRTFLDTSGLGNHPEIIRAFYQVGMKISPAKFVTGGAPVGHQGLADRMYPTKTA